MNSKENSGGDVNYYRVEVTHPKRAEPYVAECEDIIAHLGMDFFEGEAFKATWRKAAQRTLGVGKEGNTALRDAQKMAHYGARCLAIEGYRQQETPAATGGRIRTLRGYVLGEQPSETLAPDALPPEQWLPGDVICFLGASRENFSAGEPYIVQGVTVENLCVTGRRGLTGVWGIDGAEQDWVWVRRP